VNLFFSQFELEREKTTTVILMMNFKLIKPQTNNIYHIILVPIFAGKVKCLLLDILLHVLKNFNRRMSTLAKPQRKKN
jgi:hypothetical protein